MQSGFSRLTDILNTSKKPGSVHYVVHVHVCFRGLDVNRINFARDIQPLSAFRKSAAQLVDQVQESGRPLILTRNGRSAVVVLDVNTYERMIEHSELLEDLHLAREQVREGKTVAQDDVLDLLTARQAAT